MTKNRFASNAWPSTRGSLIERALGRSSRGLPDPEARKKLMERYQLAVLGFVRSWLYQGRSESEDRAQEFLRLFFLEEQGGLTCFDPVRGSFRGYVKLCLGRFLLDGIKSDKAAHRGGGLRPKPIDEEAMEIRDSRAGMEFDRRWARKVLGTALERLVDRERTILRRQAEGKSYADLETELGLKNASSAVFRARLAFEREIRGVLAQEGFPGGIGAAFDELRAVFEICSRELGGVFFF